MNDIVFRIALPLIPPSSNSSGSRTKDEIRKQITNFVSSGQSIYKYSPADKLYGRIFYFNHERKHVRDIHNIIKPLFDSLENHVYDDDKQILHFEGIRLDMQNNAPWFEVEFIMDVLNLDQALCTTCCLVEIGKLPITPSNAIRIRWLN